MIIAMSLDKQVELAEGFDGHQGFWYEVRFNGAFFAVPSREAAVSVFIEIVDAIVQTRFALAYAKRVRRPAVPPAVTKQREARRLERFKNGYRGFQDDEEDDIDDFEFNDFRWGEW